MHVMVDVFSGDDRSNRVSMVNIADDSFIFELRLLCCQLGLDILVVAVIKVTMLNTNHVVGVFLRNDLLVLNGLD